MQINLVDCGALKWAAIGPVIHTQFCPQFRTAVRLAETLLVGRFSPKASDKASTLLPSVNDLRAPHSTTTCVFLMHWSAPFSTNALIKNRSGIESKGLQFCAKNRRKLHIRRKKHQTENGLNLMRDFEVVGAERFELPTLCSQNRCATRLRYAPNHGVSLAKPN